MKVEKPLVIYHAGCWDGFCAAWVARKALGEIDTHAAQYGTEPPDVRGRVVYVLDFSYGRDAMEGICTNARRTVVLDHHKTAEEALDGLHMPECGMDVYFDMNKSGGRLAWEWFWLMKFRHMSAEDRPFSLGVRQDRAPWLVDYTEDRDLWRHALPETEAINAALRSHPLDFDLWDQFEQKDPISTLAYEGRAIRRRERQIIEDHIRHAREVEMDGHQILSVNATVLFSEIAGELAKGRPFGACYFDRFDGKRQWSLRSDPNGVDVSAIAKAHGGGGHKHAAGYEGQSRRGSAEGRNRRDADPRADGYESLPRSHLGSGAAQAASLGERDPLSQRQGAVRRRGSRRAVPEHDRDFSASGASRVIPPPSIDHEGPKAYYNENDPKTAAWLRELIKAGLIADGEVDDRSIEDVRPADLRGFTQCHFFAGIGGWSYALRLAGWPDDRSVWTGSCPCQPFSMAGDGKGINDPRHLWPAWFRLIAECRPAVIFGEQSASLDGLYWLDLVYADLEASDYALGTSDISGACLGSPDIRPRLWFVADTDRAEFPPLAYTGPEPLHGEVRSDSRRLANSHSERHHGRSADSQGRAQRSPQGGRQDEGRRLLQTGNSGAVGRVPAGDDRCGCWDRNAFHRTVGMYPGEICVNRGMANTNAGGQRIDRAAASNSDTAGEPHTDERSASDRLAHASGSGSKEQQRGWDESPRLAAAGLLGGPWSDAEWIYCRPEPRYPEGCWRPIEPGSFPLVAGVPARILRLRGYGNAIKPPVAAAFIEAYSEARGLKP